MTTTIDQLLDDWTESERTGDAAGLDALLADEFVGIGPVGFVLEREAWLDRFAGDLCYEHLELDDISTHHHGDTTIVVAHQRAVGSARGNPTPPDTRVAFTVVAADDGPRIAGIQYSFLGSPFGAPS